MKVVFHEDFYRVYASDPAAEAGRLEAVMEVIRPQVDLIPAREAALEDISAVHTSAHIEHIRGAGLYPIAALAAGGAIQAATIGMKEPCFGLIRPPGHHASSGSAWGFCFFSNMAIAMSHLKRTEQISRAYVLDIDLHFGDGTDNILGRHDWVIVHNVEAVSRAAYVEEIRDAMEGCRADIIGISAGFDNHAQDWGGLLDTEDYRTIGAAVRSAAVRNGGGCFALLEGGYNHAVLGRNVLALIEGLSA